MPQPKKGPSLGSNPHHQRLMLRSLAASLFEHERVKTTESKAKLLRPFAEHLITKAKKGTVHHRRQVLSQIEDRDIVHKLFDDIGPRFAERNGGYTRVLKLGPRNGDAAPMALIELVDEGLATTVEEEGPGQARRRRGLRRPARRRPAEGEEVATTEAEAGEETEELSEEVAEDAATAPVAESREEAEELAESADEAGASPGDATAETSQGSPGGEGEEQGGSAEEKQES